MTTTPDSAKQINYHMSRPGIGHMPSYLTSGTPFMTGALTIDMETSEKISFPRIAREVVIVTKAAPDLRVSFVEKTKDLAHTNLHYVTLTEDRDSFTFRCKCKEIYIYNVDASAAGKYELYAELTNIDSGEMYELTGSGITE